jgi:YVTN family beta-propeller protein
MIYVANSASNSMSVIDGSNNSVTSVLTGTFPYGVAVDSATNRVYVTNNSDDSVSVFTGAGVPVGLIVDPSLEGPLGVAVNPVTNTIYVANGGCPCGTTVSVINGLTNTVVTVITVGDRPSAIAVNSVTNRIYVTNAADGTVSVINGLTNTVIGAPIPEGNNPPPFNPQGIAINQVTNRIYVTDQNFGSLTTIDGSTNTAGSPVIIGFGPIGVAVDAATNLIYVADGSASQAYAVNGADGSVTTLTDPSFGGTFWVDINPATGLLYFTNASIGTVTVLQGQPGPAAASPSETCSPMVLAPGASTICTVTLTSPVPIGGIVTKTITAPSGAAITSCSSPTGGLVCGSQPNSTTLNLTCQSFSGICPPGASFQVGVSGASSGSLAQTIALTPPSGGAQTSFNLTGLTSQAGSPTVSLTSSANPSAAGQPVTFTATIACTGFTPTGTVTFKDGTTVLGAVPLSGNQAILTVSSLGTGSHPIAAVYSGDANCIMASSAVLTQVVGATAGAATLTSTANPSPAGQPLTFTATITCASVTPTGSVAFSDGATALGSVPLSGGSATFTTSSLAAGSHTITATYSGDANCVPSSATLSQSITQPESSAAYCAPAVNAPPPGAPCVPFIPSGPQAIAAAIAFCDAAYPSVQQQQACIASLLGNVGGFINPFATGGGILTAPNPPAPRPSGRYCSLPDGSKQWVTLGAPVPTGASC